MLVELQVADQVKGWLQRVVEDGDVVVIRQLSYVLEAGSDLDTAIEEFNRALEGVYVGAKIRYGVWLEVGLLSSLEQSTETVTPAEVPASGIDLSPNLGNGSVRPLSRDRARLQRSTLVRELYASGIKSTKEIVAAAAQKGHILSVSQVASVLGVMHRTEPAQKRKTLKAIVFDLVLEKRLTDQNEVLRRVRRAWEKEINEGTFQEYFRMAVKRSKEREQALV